MVPFAFPLSALRVLALLHLLNRFTNAMSCALAIENSPCSYSHLIFSAFSQTCDARPTLAAASLPLLALYYILQPGTQHSCLGCLR